MTTETTTTNATEFLSKYDKRGYKHMAGLSKAQITDLPNVPKGKTSDSSFLFFDLCWGRVGFH